MPGSDRFLSVEMTMGVVKHEAMVVVGDLLAVQRLHAHASTFNRNLIDEDECEIPLSLIHSGNNDTWMFAVLPTGSKAGWTRAQDAERLMDRLEALVEREKDYVSACRIAWGECEPAITVIEQRRRDDMGTMALARSTDPETSKAAAASIYTGMKALQENVYNVVAGVGQICDDDLITLYRNRHGYHVKESTIRTRRNELVKHGLLVDSGRRRTLPNGRSAILWSIK